MRSSQLQLGNVINLQFQINSLKLEKLIHQQNSHKALCHINCNMLKACRFSCPPHIFTESVICKFLFTFNIFSIKQ